MLTCVIITSNTRHITGEYHPARDSLQNGIADKKNIRISDFVFYHLPGRQIALAEK